MDKIRALKKHIQDKPDEEKKFIKKAVTQLTLLGIGFHAIHRLYQDYVVDNMNKALEFVPRRVAGDVTIGQLPDTSTSVFSGKFGFKTIVSIHHEYDEREVFEFLGSGEFGLRQLESLGYINNRFKRILIHDPKYQVHIYENDLNNNDFTGKNLVVRWEDGDDYEILTEDADGNEITKTVRKIDMFGRFRVMFDRVSSIKIYENLPFNANFWETDSGELKKANWALSLTEIGVYELSDLHNFSFRDNELTTVSIFGDVDVILYESTLDNQPSRGHSMLIQAGSMVDLKNRRMGSDWPNDEISAIELVDKNKYSAYVTFYENDPVKSGQKSISYGITSDQIGQIINLPFGYQGNATWIALDKGNKVEVFKGFNGEGGKWEFSNTHNREGWAHYHNLKSGGGGFNDAIGSFRVL